MRHEQHVFVKVTRIKNIVISPFSRSRAAPVDRKRTVSGPKKCVDFSVETNDEPDLSLSTRFF